MAHLAYLLKSDSDTDSGSVGAPLDPPKRSVQGPRPDPPLSHGNPPTTVSTGSPHPEQVPPPNPAGPRPLFGTPPPHLSHRQDPPTAPAPKVQHTTTIAPQPSLRQRQPHPSNGQQRPLPPWRPKRQPPSFNRQPEQPYF
jgi:hypothetical protein